MAFTVQTDTPTAGANAYVSVAYFRTYHLERGLDLTATSDANIQAAIIKATQYLDIRFKYVGRRMTSDQTTEWPRYSAWNSRGDLVSGVPTAVEQATSEYANRALSTDLLADPDRDATGREVKSTSETVGPISERIEYADYKAFELPSYPLADNILAAQGLIAGPINRNGGLSSGNTARS